MLVICAYAIPCNSCTLNDIHHPTVLVLGLRTSLYEVAKERYQQYHQIHYSHRLIIT